MIQRGQTIFLMWMVVIFLNYQLSVINYQLSITSYQLPIISYQLPN